MSSQTQIKTPESIEYYALVVEINKAVRKARHTYIRTYSYPTKSSYRTKLYWTGELAWSKSLARYINRKFGKKVEAEVTDNGKGDFSVVYRPVKKN
tara:strand:- start:288 stop:575 length:288 start_codon:yes stop_codon:yes gene_type:complete